VNTTQPKVYVTVPSEMSGDLMGCPNDTTCTSNIQRVLYHAAERKYLLGDCTALQHEWTCLHVKVQGGGFDPAVCNFDFPPGDATGAPYIFIPPPDNNGTTHVDEHGWSIHQWIEDAFVLPFYNNMLQDLRSYVHPTNGGEVDDMCAWAIVNSTAFAYGEDYVNNGLFLKGSPPQLPLCDERYHSNDVKTFCGTPNKGSPETGLEQIDAWNFQRICNRARNNFEPLRNGCQAGSGKTPDEEILILGTPRGPETPTHTPSPTPTP
jgi:hypothetical protein